MHFLPFSNPRVNNPQLWSNCYSLFYHCQFILSHRTPGEDSEGLLWVCFRLLGLAVKEGTLDQEPGHRAQPPRRSAWVFPPAKQGLRWMSPRLLQSQPLTLARHDAGRSISKSPRKENSGVHRSVFCLVTVKIFPPSHVSFCIQSRPAFVQLCGHWHLQTGHVESGLQNLVSVTVGVPDREPLFRTLLAPFCASPYPRVKNNNKKTFLNFPIPLPLRPGGERWNSIPCLLSPAGPFPWRPRFLLWPSALRNPSLKVSLAEQ